MANGFDDGHDPTEIAAVLREIAAQAALDDEEEENTSTNYMVALKWYKHGYNVVPCATNGKKHPGVKWVELQSRLVTKDELLSWHEKFDNGIGFITGKVSNIIVIETDGLAGQTILDLYAQIYGSIPKTRTIRSGSGRGLHFHFKHPGQTVRTAANPEIQVDVRGDKGFCILPPSKHKSGGTYELVIDCGPAELPEGLLEFIAIKAAQAKAGLNPFTTDMSLPHAEPKEVAGQANNGLPNQALRQVDASFQKAPPDEEMRAALQHLAAANAFDARDGVNKNDDDQIVGVGWREAGMALKLAYGDEVGFGLWGETHIDDRAREDAPAQWASFASEPKPGQVTIRTIIKAARDAGFQFSRHNSEEESASAIIEDELRTGVLGDVLNGSLFARMYRNKLVHIHEQDSWLRFDPAAGWIAAEPGASERAAKDVLRTLRNYAADSYRTAGPDDQNLKNLMKHIGRTSDARHQKAMVEMAQSEEGMTVRRNEFDGDPMLLGVANGILDLRTMKLVPPSPDLLVSKRCRVVYDPQAEAPLFMEFLRRVQPDKQVRLFLRRLMGYALTGLTSEQKFAFFYGTGANGKTVFVELFAWLLGDYSCKIAADMLMHHQRNPQGPSPDLVALKGARYVYASETDEGRRLAEARVKELTGGDTITARVPFAKAAVSFEPECKLFISGNHKPDISDMSAGMWRRIMLIDFDVTIPEEERDRDLPMKLRQEAPGILNWALEGLRWWRKDGLKIPQSVRAAGDTYRDEQDIIGLWIEESCECGPSYSVAKANLYEDYKQWCWRNGHAPMSQSKLTRRLKDRDIKLAADKRTVTGLRQKSGACR